MVKYELKKLFSNRFVLVTLIACVVITAIYAAYMSHIYDRGDLYAYENVIYQKGVLNPVTVTKDNIEELEQCLADIESDDSNYSYIDMSSRLFAYYGKYEEQTNERIREIYGLSEGRDLTAEEEQELERLQAYQISDEAFPEYYSLFYVIEQFRTLEYHTTIDYFRSMGIPIHSLDELPPAEKKELARDLTRLENGVTYDRNFGWQELLKSGKFSALPVLVAILVALSSVVALSAEYETGMYSLIVSSKCGVKSIISRKIFASALFSLIVTLIFEAAALISFGAFFSFSGGDSDSAVVLFGSVATMTECFLVMILFTLAASLAISFTSLAVSALCSKTFIASGVNLVMLLIPLIFGHFYFIRNYNLRGIIGSLPINIPLVDFGVSSYEEIVSNSVIIGAYDILLPFLPMCAILIITSIPIISCGWKQHRIEK